MHVVGPAMGVRSYPLCGEWIETRPRYNLVVTRGQAIGLWGASDGRVQKVCKTRFISEREVNEISTGAVATRGPRNATHLQVIQHHQGPQYALVATAAANDRRKAGEEEKRAGVSGVEYPHYFASPFSSVSPPRVSPPSIAHTPTV